MHRIQPSPATNLSPVQRPAKAKAPVLCSPPHSADEDNAEMPVLTPEVQLTPERDDGPPVLKPEVEPTVQKTPPIDVNSDLSTPPVLKPFVLPTPDKDGLNLKLSNGVKPKPKKRKSKAVDTNGTILGFREFSGENVLLTTFKPKKFKSSTKMGENQKKPKLFSAKLNAINKSKKANKNVFMRDSAENYELKIRKEFEESSEMMLKVLNQKSKPVVKRFGIECISDMSKVWSVDSNHTLTSMNGSAKPLQPFLKHRNFDESNGFGMDCAQSESLLAHNSPMFDNSFKIRQKLIKKSKTALNNQAMRAEAIRSPKKSYSELIGVQKPTPELEEIEGITLKLFESEEELNLYSKFEQYEKEQKEHHLSPGSMSKTFRIKSPKSGKLICPTKTKDITKIKGWREKLFSSLDDKPQNNQSFTLSNGSGDLGSHSSKKTSYTSFMSDPIIGQTSSNSDPKSAFVSSLLDNYLTTKSDLKLNYLSPDLAPPPEDSPIFSASVLKMPDISSPSNSLSSMLPPSTASRSPPPLQSTPIKRKFFKSKGIKNKSESILSDNKQLAIEPMDLIDNDVPLSERLLPQYPVIRETLWPDKPLSDEMMKELCSAYQDLGNAEAQQLKRSWNPSVTMDDHYARFALSALQCSERTPFELSDSVETSGDVLMAVGLSPKLKSPKSPKSPMKSASPVKETKSGRPKKDREADLAKIFAGGNRSKRQIRLPSRFHDSSLLMANQWIIPDYDQKGKTGKRRLQDEQKRLQELHQRQLEMEQRRQPTVMALEADTSTDELQLSLIHKNLPNCAKSSIKPKAIATTIPLVQSSDYPLKIPQVIRDQKKTMKQKNQSETPKMDKGFTSLYSMSSQTADNKRILTLSAKAAASATQRAVVNQLFLELSNTMYMEKSHMICRNGKLNKLETIKDAIETINKLVKREQQLSYIKKLLAMWNHKLQLCYKVSEKNLKPEAVKVVDDVMNTYRNSMCYKVGEALEAKRKEFQEKRAKQVSEPPVPPPSQPSVAPKPKPKPQHLFTGSQYITIPSAKSSAKPRPIKLSSKSVKGLKLQRPILPKLPELNKLKPKTETVTLSTSTGYPKLTTPDLHHKRVVDVSVDTEITREGSLIKPPLLTTRPTVLKPFMLASAEKTSITGPVINYPDISKIKSMCKMSSSPQSLIAPKSSNAKNGNASHLRLPYNNSLAVAATASNTSMGTTLSSNSQSKSSLYSPHSYAGKNVIITSETPLGNEELTRIVASITANPDTFKKVPVRLSNGMAASLTIPGSTTVTTSAKSSSIGSSSVASAHTLSIGSTPRSRGNSSETKDESKPHKLPKVSASVSQTAISSMSQTNGIKTNKHGKAEKGMVSKSDTNPYDCIEID